jgi:hypothetical protein
MWRAAAGNPDGNKPFTCWRLAVHPRIGGKLKASEVGVTLDEILNDAFGLLAAAIKDRAAPFRTVALATVAAEGAPDVRTVVLRSFDAGARRLSVHTDARSTKVAQIQAHPAVALLAWDPARRLQLRLRGQASLRAGDAMTRDAWEGLPGATRHLYRLRQAPGTTLTDPSPNQYDEAPEAFGFARFLVVEIAFDRLEALHLTHLGQIRARFDFAGAAVDAAWLVP